MCRDRITEYFTYNPYANIYCTEKIPRNIESGIKLKKSFYYMNMRKTSGINKIKCSFNNVLKILMSKR